MKTPIICLSVLLLAGCAPTPETSVFDFEAASAIITEHTERFTQAHVSGEVDVLNSLFADDARAYAPGEDVVAGMAQIGPLNAQWVAYGIDAFSEVSTRRYGGPDHIVDEGTYTMMYGPEKVFEKGHYINVWKRVGDDWKLYANMWTAMTP